MCLLPDLEYPAKFPAPKQDKAPVTKDQSDGMDDMLEFAEKNHDSE